MNQTAFLPGVVSYFTSPASTTALHDITFILPNKRSALFLKKYIRESCRATTLMPRIMTLRTFVSTFASFPEASQQELLFILYDAYRTVMQQKGRAEGIKQFDSFIFWGDMMLNDFNDVDNALANASEIFKNLVDVKEIQANYLDDDQKEAIRRIWGESRLTANIEDFWMHVKPDDSDSITDRFIYLWEILGDIYSEFHRLLKANRCATAGSQMLEAIENVKEASSRDFTGNTRYAFVGFDDFTAAESVFADRLYRQGATYFFWDSAALRLFEAADNSAACKPAPLRRLEALLRHFPMPDDYEQQLPQQCPKVEVTAVPSNVGQAKAVDAVLRQWLAEGFYNPADSINTAIVLPDQGLLLPVLTSIPPQVESVNISMGLPYRTTTFASLLHSIISMQLRSRKIRGEYHFYYEDVESVLTHPHIQTIAASDADTLTALINEKRLFNVAASTLVETCPELKALFTPVRASANVHETASYLNAVLDKLGLELTKIAENSTVPAGRNDEEKFEVLAIDFFRRRIAELTALIDRFNVDMSESTFFHLFEKVFYSTGLTLAGTPLAGMQLLGILETRNLDFDNVIVLSMNEGTLPRRRYSKTMIPANLRIGYGLPDIDASEWAYAYSFYRLVARAKRVALFYDSRPEGVGNGEKSRYISQLDYLANSIKLSRHVLTMGARNAANSGIAVTKTPQIMEHVNRFRFGGDLRFSATAIKSYLQCPLQFYLKYIRRMRADNDLSDNMSAAEYGTAVHTVIQTLFDTHPSGKIDADTIESWLDGTGASIADIVLRHLDDSIYTAYKGLPIEEHPVECRVAADAIEMLVRSNLAAEKAAYCNNDFFQYIGKEVDISTAKAGKPWQAAPGIDINFYMSIDRLDRCSDGTMRIVDFKTGADEIKIDKIDDLSKGKHSKMAIFQILLYCEAYLALVDKDAEITPSIHLIRSLAAAVPIEKLRVNKKELVKYDEVREKFCGVLSRIISEIFDPETPFAQNDDENDCMYCPFVALCGRNPKMF